VRQVFVNFILADAISASEATRARRAAKSGNKNGNPIALQSKILDIVADPYSTSCVYVAESAGCIRKINIEVGEPTWPFSLVSPSRIGEPDFDWE
jgi:hypothetical protein